MIFCSILRQSVFVKVIGVVDCDKQETYRCVVDDLRSENDSTLAIEANHTLLRCLTCLRPIDYVISKQTSLDVRKKLRDDLYQKFQVLSDIIRDPDVSKAKLKKEEKKFNTHLIEALHEANLTKGCSTKKDAESLLAHYSMLSSVLEPVQRETQYPVREKTELQKNSANVLNTVIPYPLGGEINAHTVHNEAEQQANSCFSDLLVTDDRHLFGVENAQHKIKNVDCFKKPSDAAYKEYEANRTKLEEILKLISDDCIYAEMKTAAEKILNRAKDRSDFKAKDYTHVNEIYKLVTHVMEHVKNNVDLDKKMLNDIGLNLQRIDKMCKVLSGNDALVAGIKKFVQVALISLSVLLFLNIVPFCGPVFFVAGVITATAMKLGAALGIWQEIAWNVILTRVGSLDEKSGHSVLEKTREFSKTGHAFFKAEVKKLDTKKEGPELQDNVEEKDEESKDKGGSGLDTIL
jgi:hypothetical protein